MAYANDHQSEQSGDCVPLGTIDLRLRPFIEKCELFCERALEMLPDEDAELMQHVAASQNGSRPAAAAGSGYAPTTRSNPKAAYWKTCEALTIGALRLPCLERVFSTAWPHAVRYILPSDEPGSRLEHTWSPVLAWIALRSLPADGIRIEVFEKLHLRAALADIFSSTGIEDDQTWRMAARIGILLRQADNPAATIETKEFWSDPDVRWLAGVNESSGRTWFNKELFEELLVWVQLPALMEIAQQPVGESRAIANLEEAISRAGHAATQCGYNLDTYLKVLCGDPVEEAAALRRKSDIPVRRR